MKKLLFTLGAVLTIGMASAQTEPATVKKDKTKTTAVTQEKQADQKEQGIVQPPTAPIAPQAVNNKEKQLQNSDVSKDHVKATPVPKNAKDTVAVKKSTVKKS